MSNPKRIDDRLKDAIVNIQFVSGVPADTVVGYFHSICREYLKDSHNFFNQFNIATAGLTIEANSSFFVTKNERLRIDISPQNITFNLLSGYNNLFNGKDGWSGYFSLVQEIVRPLFEQGIIKQVQRIGVRYISQFENVSIYDCTNLKVDLGIEAMPRRGQLRVEFEKENFWSIITLLNNYPITVSSNLGNSFFSLIDIDVIKNFSSTQFLSFEDLVKDLDKAHDIEKKIFFSILNPVFLQSLNPIY